MQGDSDISRLYEEFGGDPGEYREITEQEKAEAARHRWPMYGAARPGDAGLMPPAVDEGRNEKPVPVAPWPPGGASAALPPVSGGHGAPVRRGAALGAGSTHRWWTEAQGAPVGEALQDEVEPETVSVPVVAGRAPMAAPLPAAEVAAPLAAVAVEPAVVPAPAPVPAAEVAAPVAAVAVEPVIVPAPAPVPVAEVAAPVAAVAPAVVATRGPAPLAPIPEAAAPAVQPAKPSAATGASSLKGVFDRLVQAHRSDAQPPSGSGA